MIRFENSGLINRLVAVQKLPISKEEAWDFLSNPKNLKKITPPEMGFIIKTQTDIHEMYAGQIIEYTVYPFPKIKTSWVTEITHVEKGFYFVDEQRFGPYQLWHHKHFIIPIEGGVEMKDIIDYKVPFGILGQLLNRFLIQKQLKNIFQFRERKLNEIFNNAI